MSYLALGDGPPAFPPDSSCPVVLRIPLDQVVRFGYKTFTSFGVTFQSLHLHILVSSRGPYPVRIASHGLGSFPFAHHYSGNHSFIFSSSGYLDVSVPRVPFRILLIHIRIPIHYDRCVPTFGYLRIKAHLQLPVAFRSLSRPSSAHSAKASFLRSYSLNRFRLLLSLTNKFSENLFGFFLFPQQNIIFVNFLCITHSVI